MSDLLAFSAEHVERLTGLTRRQLAYWDRTGFFSPRYSDENRHRPYSRIYSFRDVVGLRAIAVLHGRYGIGLRELRKVGKHLQQHHETPWASLTLYVGGKKVFFDDPETGARLAGHLRGQHVMPFAMAAIEREVRTAAEELRTRRADQVGQLEKHRYVVHNAMVLAGTRIPTSAVWDFYQAGYDTEAIIREYPRLTPADIQTAIAYEEQRRQKRIG